MQERERLTRDQLADLINAHRWDELSEAMEDYRRLWDEEIEAALNNAFGLELYEAICRDRMKRIWNVGIPPEKRTDPSPRPD